jgi:hypothetical protein
MGRASVGEKINTYCMRGKVKETLLGRLGIGGRSTLNWIFEIQDERVWTRLICLRAGTNGGLL